MRTTNTAVRLSLILSCWSVFTIALAQSPAAYTVHGDLRDESGQLFSGATVCAIPADAGIINVRDKVCKETDAQGQFTLNLRQAGKYQIIGEKLSEGYMPPYVPFYRDFQRPIPEIIVDEGNRNASVSFALGPKSGLITGKVIDEAEDTPIQDFVVWVWQARNPNARYRVVVKGNQSPGRFKLYAPPVPFRLRVEADGHEDWVMGGGVLVSAAGPRKAPGTLLVRSGSTADFAVYLKKKPGGVESGNNDSEKRLTAPVQVNPRDNAVFDLFPRTTELEWSPVAGAASYAVEVESCWNPPSPPRTPLPDDGECINPSPFLEKFGIFDTNFKFDFKGSQPGRWRVWAIDSNRRPGRKSAWRRFVYQK